jgi:NitT/TauT family transport system permease protein
MAAEELITGRRRFRPREAAIGLAWGLGAVAALVAIWWLAAWLARIGGDLSLIAKVPYPGDVAAAMRDYAPTLIDAAWSTGSRAVVGFLIGLVVGTLFGVAMIQSRWIEYGLVPYILASQMVPLIALVPVLQSVLRDPDLVRLYVSGYVTFFVVSMAVLRGLKDAKPVALELMDSINASRWTTLRYLQLPAALPYIFTGLRVAAPLSLIGSILVDFLGARNGIGYLLVASLSIGSSQSTILWAALVISMALGLLFTRVIVVLERRLCFWQPAFREVSA